MAKELGVSPRNLIKNIPSSKQQWKAPVEDWVREIYEKRHGATSRREPVSLRTVPSETERKP